MTVNDLMVKLTNIKISYETNEEQVLFGNADIFCRMKGNINIVDEVEYDKEQGIVILY